MYKYVKETYKIWYYTYALSFHTGAPSVNWEDNTSSMYVVEA